MAASDQARASRARPPRPRPAPAVELPVVRVAVDVGLAHLDRPFDFLVPATLAATALPGVRVRVRFAGRLVNGYVVERAAVSAHSGQLAFLDRVVSPEQVLTPPVLRLARQVADRCAGTLADVLRLAIPPRHARAEGTVPDSAPAEPAPRPALPRAEPGSWSRYQHGATLLDAVHTGAGVRAVWSALPGPTWPQEVATLMAAALSGGRGALVVLPDHRDVARVDAAMTDLVGTGRHLVLTAEPGPAQRYRRWLQVLRGEVRAVVGTRAAMFAPVRDLGLVLVWDDGDDLHAEPRAPYPHVRTVLALRSAGEGAALVVAGHTRSAEGAALVRSGWARSVTASRPLVRQYAPSVLVTGGSEDRSDAGAGSARLPSVAWRAAAKGLTSGPVLVQVPRRGYVPGLACATCRAPARCQACRGPLGTTGGGGTPVCRWCAVQACAWGCPSCAGRRLRATVVGSLRTAEELGRAFPRTLVRTSGAGGEVLASVGAEPALVVATPGAEPVAEGGYAAALLLDGWALLGRPDLRAAEEALRRWTAAAALVRPAPAGGTVILLAEASTPAVQALVRWDHAGFADRELAERAALRLPPEARMASLSGTPSALAAYLDALPGAGLPGDAEILGPVPVPAGAGGEPQERFLVRAPGPAWATTVAALKTVSSERSAHKDPGGVRVQVDPLEIA